MKKLHLKNIFKDCIMRHPVKSLLVAVSALFVFAYFLLWLLTCVDTVVPISKQYFTRLSGEVETWFTFFGSYLGVIATVFLGIITLRFSIKVDLIDRTSRFNELNIGEVRLYDLKKDFTPSAIGNHVMPERYVLTLEFKSFSPYYNFSLKSVRWGTLEKEFKEDQIINIESEHFKYNIEEGSDLKVYLYIDELRDEFNQLECNEDEAVRLGFDYFYRIHCYEPVAMQPYERQRYLELQFNLSNRIWREDKKKKRLTAFEEIPLEIKLKLENDGFRHGGMDLAVRDRKLKVDF